MLLHQNGTNLASGGGALVALIGLIGYSITPPKIISQHDKYLKGLVDLYMAIGLCFIFHAYCLIFCESSFVLDVSEYVMCIVLAITALTSFTYMFDLSSIRHFSPHRFRDALLYAVVLWLLGEHLHLYLGNFEPWLTLFTGLISFTIFAIAFYVFLAIRKRELFFILEEPSSVSSNTYLVVFLSGVGLISLLKGGKYSGDIHALITFVSSILLIHVLAVLYKNSKPILETK